MKEFIFNLQLFADAGTLVNATGNYINAYTGEATEFSGVNTLAGELKTFYDTELLENARIDMYYAQFAKKQALPANHGKTVEWRKWNTFARAGQLVEGVIPTGQKFGMSSKTASINQFGTYAAITDILELRAYDDTILGATEEMGASAAETQEALIRDALYVGTNVLYCDNYVGDTFKSTPTGVGGMYNDSTNGYALLTPDMVAKAVTKLKKDKAKTINGKYVAVIHPSVAYDLRKSEGWLEAHKYAAPEEIFNGEIGELHGVRFIEDTFAPIIKDSIEITLNGAIEAGATTSFNFDGATVAADELIGMWVKVGGAEVQITDNTASSVTFASTTLTAVNDNTKLTVTAAKGGSAVYATYFFAQDAFGIIDPAGGALQMIIKDKSEIGGPLNQFSTIGYKFETNGATILYPERVLRVMSVSSYSDVDEEN